jgi:O-antigen/teichoic acid export membrane protein
MSIGFDDPEYASEPGVLQTDTLTDSVLILLALTVVQRLVGIVRAVLFCRWLDPEQLGLWDMAFSFLMLAAPLCVLSIPGVFGRYVESYRLQGQLRAFLQRMMLGCGALAIFSLTGIILAREWFSNLVFGTPDEQNLIVLAAVCLITIIAYNFLVELFTALRNIRMASGLQFINSVAFAVLGLGLLAGWRCSAQSVLLAYSAACLLTAAWAGRALYRVLKTSPQTALPMSQPSLWAKILPFAAWILVGNIMTNVFGMLDRYMIVHFSNIPAHHVMDVIGSYHSSRVIPMLLMSLATMLGIMIMPHLSHDWEAGRRDQVAARLQLFIKLIGFAMVVASVAVLFIAPLLFGVAFRGKFPEGEAVLPFALVYSTWFGLLFIVQNYLLCAEHARLTSLALFIGLLLNIGLNLLLLPKYGLLGAVLSTTAANGLSLFLVCVFNHRLGFHIDGGTRWILAMPVLLSLGPWPATLAIVLVLIDAVYTKRILTSEEDRQIAETINGYKARIRANRWVSRFNWHVGR